MFLALVTLAFPMATRSESGGDAAVCGDNLRQLLKSTAQYAADHNDRLPPPNWGFNANYAGWLCKPPYSAGETNVMTGVLWKYGNDLAVYRCPLDKTNTASFQQRKQKYTSYIMNGSACFFEFQRTPRTPAISSISPKAILFWQADERNFRDYNDGASRPDEGSTRLHSEGTPIGVMDGSAEQLSVRDFNLEALRRPGRLWWNQKAKDGSG